MLGYIALFAICLWPFTHFFDANISELFKADPFAFVQPLALCFTFFLAVFAFTVIWRKTWGKGKQYLFNVQLLLIAFFLVFQPVYAFSGTIMNALGFNRGAIIVFSIIVLFSVLLLKKLSSNEVFNKSIYVGIIVASTVPMLSNINYIYALYQYNLKFEDANSHAAVETSVRNKLLPNVYYIVADGMVGERAYKTITGNDLDSLVKPFSEKPWVYLPDARSNYIASASSIGSLFHLDFFRTEKTDVTEIRTDDYFPAITTRPEIPPLYQFLQDLGYEFTFSGSWYSGCREVWHECVESSHFQLNRESLLLIDRTLLTKLFPAIAHRKVDSITPLKERIKLGVLEKPTFNFVHHMQPHSPWYYNSQCEDIDVRQYSDRKLYQYSVECLFKTLNEFAQTIEEVDPSALIVVHGDHGWLMNEQALGVKETDWSANILDQRSEILALLKVPEYCREWLKNDLGPLNIMKFVVGCIEQKKPNYVDEKLFIPGENYAKDEQLVDAMQKLHDLK